jgi:N-acetyltransferase 10
MVRKKIDSRIRTIVENSVKENTRTFFVIVGDNAREQVFFSQHASYFF